MTTSRQLCNIERAVGIRELQMKANRKADRKCPGFTHYFSPVAWKFMAAAY